MASKVCVLRRWADGLGHGEREIRRRRPNRQQQQYLCVPGLDGPDELWTMPDERHTPGSVLDRREDRVYSRQPVVAEYKKLLLIIQVSGVLAITGVDGKSMPA